MATEIRLDKTRLDSKTKVLLDGEGSPDELASLYYQVIEALHLPVRNHTTVRSKIKEMAKIRPREYVIRYLTFMRDQYPAMDFDYKPDVNEALEVYTKMKQIENACKRANRETVKAPKGFTVR